MTDLQSFARSRRSLAISVVFVAGLVILALVFHRPLIAWFTGESTDGAGASTSAQTGGLSIKATLEPDPPAMKGNTLVVEIHDASGRPVDDAKIDVVYDMPAMAGMSEMKGNAKVTPTKDGRYRAEFDLPMGGNWPLLVHIQTPTESVSQIFKLTVGSKGLSAEGASGAIADPGAAHEIDHYTCSMHPSVNQKGPGKCPICGMDLIPVTKEQQAEGVVLIDDARRQLIGVRTAPVVEAPMRATVRAVGRVAYDESALTEVNLKVRGWITKLLVTETGQHVTKGQTLFTMYSPELYNAQQDFLLATHGASASATSASDAGPTRMQSLGGAARQRLRLLGMEDAQIDAIAKSGAPAESIAVPSPASGFVIEKNVVEGASVDAGMRLYRIAALNKVWVEAEVYEADLPNVRVGQPVKVTLDYVPGRTYDAKVAYIYPYLESQSRTGRVRIEIANKELDLRPGMYASIELGADVGNRVQVPSSAVVYTGPRRLVFVDLGQGRFKPQEIHVGSDANGMVEVLDGLKPGDLVATSGVFLIAAEARISTAATYWESSGDEDDSGTLPEMPPSSPSASKAAATHAMPSMPMPKTRSGSMGPAPSASDSATVYSCPMHPDVRSATPGKCPKCGMDLQPIKGKP